MYVPPMTCLPHRIAGCQQCEGKVFALPCPHPKACREHCCSGQCIPKAELNAAIKEQA